MRSVAFPPIRLHPLINPREMSASVIQIGVHSSQWPQQIRAELRQSLRSRRINPKFHYDSLRQARHWLRLHEACSPARRDGDCLATYDRAFAATAQLLGPAPLQLIGLGCGGGQKERRLLELIPNAAERASFVAVDVSWPLTLIARQETAVVLPDSSCQALVCDLVTAGDLLAELDRLAAVDQRRLVTCFGVIPNFEPKRILPQLSALLRPNDHLLLSANLVRADDYQANLKRILPQYENALTYQWLSLLLEDLGVDSRDGQMESRIERDPAGESLARIAIDFVFARPRSVTLDDEEFRFEREDRLGLFFSYRHTPSSVHQCLDRHGIALQSEWITASGEEGIFLGRRIA